MKLKIFNFINNILAIVFIIFGLFGFSVSFSTGIVLCFMGLVVLPYTSRLFLSKFNFKVPSYVKITLTIFLFLSLGLTSNSKVVDNHNKFESAQEFVGESESEKFKANESITDKIFKSKETSVAIDNSEQQSKKSDYNSISQNDDTYQVTEVVDGDTIKINFNEKIETVRLIGLDTPETVDPRKPVQCFGKEASNKARELLYGRKVTIEKDPTQGERDKYGRLLVYVYREDGLFFNKYMIEQGYAYEYTYDNAYKYQSEFKQAQKDAQAGQLGLWSSNTCNGNTTITNSSSVNYQHSSPGETQKDFGSLYYTSSHYSAKYYYPESCTEWKQLSPNYLKSYESLESLLSVYPTKTQSPQCD